MDPQVEQWQRQAQEAMQAQPDRKDAIAAQLHEMITTLATTTWANQAQEAVDAGIPRQQVLDQYKGMLQEHGLAVSPESNFDEWFKQGRAPQFKNVKTGSSTTAAPVGYEDRKAEAAKLAEANTNSEIPAPNPMTAEDMAFAKSKEPPRGRTVGQKLEDFSSAAGNVTVAALQDAAVKIAEAGAGANILAGQEPMAEPLFKYIQEATKDSERRRAVASGDSTLGTIAGEVAGAIAPVSALSKAGKAMDVGETLTARALAAMKQQLPAATALGNIQADSLARNVIERGGSTEEALAVLGTGTALNTAANLLPVSASGNVLKRAVTGGALGAGGNLAADAGIGLVSDKVPGASWEGTLAGGGIGTIFGVLSGTRPNTRIRTELPPVPPGMEAFNAGQIAAGDIAKTASFDTPIDLNAPFIQKFDTIQRKAPTYGAIPETKVNVDGIETGRVDMAPLSPVVNPELIRAQEIAIRENANRVEPQPRPLYDMTLDELRRHAESVTKRGVETEDAILGEQVGEWRKAQRAQNSMDDARADAASKTIDRIESGLSQRDRDALYGVGDSKEAWDDAEDYRQELQAAQVESPGEASERLAFWLSKLGNTRGTDPSAWTRDQQVAYAATREVRNRIEENGWDSREIQKSALQRAAGRYSDTNDAEMMLDRFLKPEPEQKAIASETSEPILPNKEATPPNISAVPARTNFPSQEGVSMSVTEQPKVSYPIQGKNVPLVKKQPVTTAGITTPPIGSKIAAAADTPVVTRETVQEKIDRLKKGESLPPQLSSLVLEDGTTISESVPKHIQDKLQAGTLTAREVLDASAPALDTDAPAVKEAKNLITWLKATAERIGGEKVILNIFDANDAHHLEMAPRNEKGELDNFAAFYSPADNRIYVKRGAEQAPTLVHEVAHGILSKLLHMGSQGQLKGPAAKAYADVSGTFNFLLKPELEKRAGPRPEGGTAKEKLDHAMKTYGLSDKDGKLDEMVSELFSNSKFRQTLKDIKLDPQTLSSLPPLAQGWAKKATNMYELIVRGLSRMMAHAGIRSYADMGMADKATNGYDLMFAQIDRLASSVSDADAAALKDYSTRNTTPDIQEVPGLGEQVERRSLPKQSMEEKSTLVKPMSGKMAKLKSMFLVRGTEPALTKRQEFLSGAKKEIKANKTALSNRATAIVSKMDDGEYASLVPHLDTFLSDSSMSTVTSRNAFNEIKKASPELAKLYKELTDKRTGTEHGGSVGIAQSLIDSQAGRKTPNELVLNLANKVIDNAYSFTPRTYQGREATRAKWELAEAGQKKLEAGKLLSNKEETAVREQNALLDYVADNVFGNKESLKKLSFDALHDLYVQRFSADQYATLKGLSKEDKRRRMVVEVAEANAALGNRPAAIKEYAAKIADMGDEADKISKNYAQLKYGSGTLGTIDDVPKPIRDFWGELHDPTARLIEAVTKQDTHLAEVRSLQTLREEGLGTLFAKEEGQGMTEKLSGSKYGALEDLHTTPHIKEMIDTVVEMRPDRSMFDMWADLAPAMSIPLRAIRFAKTSATVYRLDALVRNAIGSFAQLYSNGNVNPYKQAQYGYRGLKAAVSLMGMSHRKSIADDAALLLRLDLAEASTIADTYSPSARLAVDKLLQAVGENPESSVTFLRKLGNLADSGNTLAKELYGSVDIWTKFGNFFYELDAQKAYNDARGIKMTEKALQEQVADRIKQTNITPSRSPRWIQAVEAPGGTTYMGYYYETARTSANNLLYGLGDIKKGLADIKDGHGKAGAMMLNHGVKRVVGVVGAVGFTGAAYTGIAKAVLAGLGISASVAGDNEELKEYMEDDGFQDPDTTLVTKDSKTGKDYGIDIGSINPYEPIWSIIKPLGKAIANPSEGLEGVGKSVDKALGLISASSVLKGAQKAWNGTKPYLEKSDPELYTNLQQRGVDAGLSPATVDRLINVLFPVTPGGLKDSAKRSFMDTDDTTKELTHIGARELNPAKDIRSFLGRSFTWDLKKAKDNYAQWLTTPATITPTKLEKGFKDAMDDIAKPYKKLANAVNAGVSMGKTEDELYASLKSANVDKETIGSILEDEVYPARLVYSDMKSLMRKQLDNELDEDKRDALADKWDVKMEMLQDILEKYEDLTLEQLEQGASRAK